MKLYADSTREFIRATTQNRIVDTLKHAFEAHYRHAPAPSEINAWNNSLKAMALLISAARLDDNGVLLEYELPSSSRRLDCMLTGRNAEGEANAVIVELKQWEKAYPTDGDKRVRTFVGHAERDMLHPAVQVDAYRRYLEDMQSAFYDDANPIRLGACAYLHNYGLTPDDALLDPKFQPYLDAAPVFDKGATDRLTTYLSDAVGAGQGLPLLDRIENSEHRPSRKLMQHVAETIRGEHEWVLLDEQLVIFDRVLASIEQSLRDNQKRIVLINGGPGTGKSVVAINLLARLMQLGRHAHYSTASKAFTSTLRKRLGPRGSALATYFNNYGSAPADSVDVLICDEAHRLKKDSTNRFTPAAKKTGKTQLDELVSAARVSVFFVDDLQVVRAGEIGNAELIRQEAARRGVPFSEHRLEVQFRCAGSAGFVNWVDNTLDIRKTANILWNERERFDFRIVESVQALDGLIAARARQKHTTARLMAGYCWPWSDVQADGSLVEDVQIGDWRRPWNARPEGKFKPKDAPPAELWAYDPKGYGQVGCVYTAQGFEFDYAGVIWGNDLTYDWDTHRWVVDPKRSHDRGAKNGLQVNTPQGRERFLALVKNTYRVLLSRGMKGCYVHFMDKGTERFVRSRVEAANSSRMGVADAELQSVAGN